MPSTKTRSKPVPSSRRTIGQQLREVIEASGLTAYALGRDAEVNPGIIQRFLNGERGLTLETINRLGLALGLRLVEGSRSRGRPSKPSRIGTLPVAKAPSACQTEDSDRDESTPDLQPLDPRSPDLAIASQGQGDQAEEEPFREPALDGSPDQANPDLIEMDEAMVQDFGGPVWPSWG
jgi:transcriptional regulator with XRE-family HTH domain